MTVLVVGAVYDRVTVPLTGNTVHETVFTAI
jgi:hypothetical protein